MDRTTRLRYVEPVSARTTVKLICRTRRGAVLAALAVALAAPRVSADDGNELMADVWSRFRAAKSEREASEILVISNPQEGPYTLEQLRPMLASPPTNVRHKRAVRRALYDADGVDKTHVLFSLPAEDAGLGLLIFAGVRAPSDRMWLYMPGYRSVRQIPATNTQRFADTDLIYEDVRSRAGDRTADFDYVIEKTDACDGRTCQIVSATPKDGGTSSYSRRVFSIDEQWRFPVRVEFYDRNGDLWKWLRNSEVREVAPGMHRADLAEMRDLARKSTTVLMVTDRGIGIDIPRQVFTRDYLEHPDAS